MTETHWQRLRARRLGKVAGAMVVIGFFAIGYYLLSAKGHSAPAGAMATHPTGETLVMDGTLEADEVDVSSKLPGRLAALTVDEGDHVHAGQVLAVIEADELDAKREQAVAGVHAAEAQTAQGEIAVELERRKADDQVTQAQAGVEAARASLGMARAKLAALENGARPQEVAQAEQAVAAAQAAYDTASKTYTRLKALAEEGVIAQQKADEAEMAYRSASAQLTAARAKLDLVHEGARKEEIAAARAQVKQAEAGVAAAQGALRMAGDARTLVDIRRKDVEAARQKVAASRGTVREVEAYRKQMQIVSPIDGRISQRMSRAGEIVAPGYAILSVMREDDYWVDVYVDESKFAGHRVGERVRVEIPAVGREAPGEVTRVLPAADFATKRATNEKGAFDIRAVQVRIALRAHPQDAAAGLTARVHFPNDGGR